jgi:hypothetical protein
MKQSRPIYDVSTGQRCDGHVPTGVIHLSVGVPGDHEMTWLPLLSPQERRRNTEAAGCGFWKNLFLQVSHSQPAAKHALIAVAPIHESIELSGFDTIGYNDTVARKRRAFFLIHYNGRDGAPSSKLKKKRGGKIQRPSRSHNIVTTTEIVKRILLS